MHNRFSVHITKDLSSTAYYLFYYMLSVTKDSIQTDPRSVILKSAQQVS